MVGLVLVSHVRGLAEGAAELGRLMAPAVVAEPAGGLADGSPGTDYERIMSAVESVLEQCPEGVLVVADMGSSVMTAEMVMEDLGDERVVLADCPFAEGTVAAMVSASAGESLEAVRASAEETRGACKR